MLCLLVMLMFSSPPLLCIWRSFVSSSFSALQESDERQSSSLSSSSPPSARCWFHRREKEANRLSCPHCGCCSRRRRCSPHLKDSNRFSSASSLGLSVCPSPQSFSLSSSSHSPVGSVSSPRRSLRRSSSSLSSSSSSRKALSFLSEIEDLQWKSKRSRDKHHNGEEEEEEVRRRQSSRDIISSSSFPSHIHSFEKMMNACNASSSSSSVTRTNSLLHSLSNDHVASSAEILSSLDKEKVPTSVKIDLMKKIRGENINNKKERDSENEIIKDNQLKTRSPLLSGEVKKKNVHGSPASLSVQKERKSLYTVYPSSSSLPCCSSCRYMTFLNEMKGVKITNRLLATLSRSFLTNKLLVRRQLDNPTFSYPCLSLSV